MGARQSLTSESELFPLDEPPTFPQRGTSGGIIKAPVIRAMANQHATVKEALTALDRFVRATRGLAKSPPPTPEIRRSILGQSPHPAR